MALLLSLYFLSTNFRQQHQVIITSPAQATAAASTIPSTAAASQQVTTTWGQLCFWTPRLRVRVRRQGAQQQAAAARAQAPAAAAAAAAAALQSRFFLFAIYHRINLLIQICPSILTLTPPPATSISADHHPIFFIWAFAGGTSGLAQRCWLSCCCYPSRCCAAALLLLLFSSSPAAIAPQPNQAAIFFFFLLPAQQQQVNWVKHRNNNCQVRQATSWHCIHRPHQVIRQHFRNPPIALPHYLYHYWPTLTGHSGLHPGTHVPPILTSSSTGDPLQAASQPGWLQLFFHRCYQAQQQFAQASNIHRSSPTSCYFFIFQPPPFIFNFRHHQLPYHYFSKALATAALLTNTSNRLAPAPTNYQTGAQTPARPGCCPPRSGVFNLPLSKAAAGSSSGCQPPGSRPVSFTAAGQLLFIFTITIAHYPSTTFYALTTTIFPLALHHYRYHWLHCCYL